MAKEAIGQFSRKITRIGTEGIPWSRLDPSPDDLIIAFAEACGISLEQAELLYQGKTILVNDEVQTIAVKK